MKNFAADWTDSARFSAKTTSTRRFVSYLATKTPMIVDTSSNVACLAAYDQTNLTAMIRHGVVGVLWCIKSGVDFGAYSGPPRLQRAKTQKSNHF
jgi:hypothetical protein